jgi:hypothetical protein
MKQIIIKVSSVIVIISVLCCAFSSCKNVQNENAIVDVITLASTVSINGEKTNTVEASLGAFKGSQGDYIEFFFDEAVTFNSFFINEKTTSIRQYNIYAMVDNKYKLIHTGKHVTIENIYFDPVTTTAIKFVIVNTEIGNDEFIIQGISAYKSN